MRHHGWHGTQGKLAIAGLTAGIPLGALQAWADGSAGWIVTMLAVAGAVGVITPLSLALSAVVRWWRLRSARSGWVAHWCEGPDGELAIRMTHPKPATAEQPERWPGLDLYGIGGAGRRLLGWLQNLADDNGAALLVRTTQPRLVPYYENAGLTTVSRPWLRIGTAMQLGKTVLSYPPPRDANRLG